MQPLRGWVDWCHDISRRLHFATQHLIFGMYHLQPGGPRPNIAETPDARALYRRLFDRAGNGGDEKQPRRARSGPPPALLCLGEVRPEVGSPSGPRNGWAVGRGGRRFAPHLDGRAFPRAVGPPPSGRRLASQVLDPCWQESQATRIASISTTAHFGSPATPMAARAG